MFEPFRLGSSDIWQIIFIIGKNFLSYYFLPIGIGIFRFMFTLEIETLDGNLQAIKKVMIIARRLKLFSMIVPSLKKKIIIETVIKLIKK